MAPIENQWIDDNASCGVAGRLLPKRLEVYLTLERIVKKYAQTDMLGGFNIAHGYKVHYPVAPYATQFVTALGTIRSMNNTKSFPAYLLIVLLLIGILAMFGPEEQSLGSNVRLVYLHGAWVLTAEIAFLAAALAGLLGLVLQRDLFHAWSTALGRTGIIFWVSYLPLSLLAMQANWNGLFLSEPRFRLAMIFAVTGVLLQVGLWLFNLPWLTSLANIAFIIVLRAIFASAENVMHPPPSPIFNSGNYLIIGFFITLNLLAWLVAYFLTRILLRRHVQS